MALVHSQGFPKHFDARISKIFFDEFATYQGEYDKIAKISEAPAGSSYTEAEMSGLGVLREYPEGTGVQFDIPVEGNEKNRTYTGYALGVQITRNSVKDDLFNQFERIPKKLSKSAAQKPETVFWDLFNNAFATHTAIDGDYIFSASHTPLKAGSDISNLGSGALSETTLQAAFEYYWGLVDEANMPIVMYPNKLVLPVELTWMGEKLRRTVGKVGSADHDINSVRPEENTAVNGWEPFYSRYLTSSTAWYLLSDEHDFRVMWKERAELESSDDFATGNRLYKVSMRFTAFCNQWRGAYGSTGA